MEGMVLSAIHKIGLRKDLQSQAHSEDARIYENMYLKSLFEGVLEYKLVNSH